LLLDRRCCSRDGCARRRTGSANALHDHVSEEPPANADSGTAVFDFSASYRASFTCFLDGAENPTPCVPPVTYTATILEALELSLGVGAAA
jgi:hypothetical protein